MMVRYDQGALDECLNVVVSGDDDDRPRRIRATYPSQDYFTLFGRDLVEASV